MNKDAYGTNTFDGDVEPLLPDGWEEGMDIFADTDVKDDLDLADEQSEESLADVENESEESDEATPTTGEEAEEESSADADDKPTQESASRIRKLKVNHEEREIDLGALSDDDLIAHLQKSYAFDAMRERENQQKYREIYQQQLDAGMTEYVAKLVAKEAAGKAYALTDEEETKAEEAPAAQTADRDFAREVEQLKALYPDIKQIPDEVANAAAKGVPVLTAFLAYREKQSAKTAAALKAENKVLKQNAASAAKAPVKGVTGGGTASAKKKSIYEDAFDAGFKWN